MTDAPSRAIALYGTEEDVAVPRVLTAGRLSAELEAGNLRAIRWDGAEVLRAVAFLVRDRDWGAFAPEIRDLEITEADGRFVVTLSAVVADAERSFVYTAGIEGSAEGRLTFRARGGSETGFETNRTGFVVLHPVEGVAGTPVTVTHTDGREEEDVFPAIIAPAQPMTDLRGLAHTTPEGLRVSVVMEGDTFEMEDQRNWSDASYKTYGRPLALPRPYEIAPGAVIEQSVTVTVAGEVAAGASGGELRLALGEDAGDVPPLGLGLRPEDVAAATEVIDALRALAPSYLVLHHDKRAGHGPGTLVDQLTIARAARAEPWLEAVIAEADEETAVAEVTELGEMVASLGVALATVLVSFAPDPERAPPDGDRSVAPDAARLHAAVREAFPGVPVGGGTFGHFTALNRHRPSENTVHLVSFTTSPLVHAGDDRSVMQTREAHPAIIASVRAIAGTTPWAVGPSAIGMRGNPCGAAAGDNPDNIRQAKSRGDPRQRGLFGASWALGYFADFACGGAAGVALGAPVGAFGAIAVPMEAPQPWFDEAGGLYPVFHVLRGLAGLRGAALHRLDLPPAAAVNGLAARTAEATEIWVGNAGPDPVRLRLPPGRARGAVLDAGGFVAAARDPSFLDALRDLDGPRLELDAFAVARIVMK